jgi:hypothetical protein
MVIVEVVESFVEVSRWTRLRRDCLGCGERMEGGSSEILVGGD